MACPPSTTLTPAIQFFDFANGIPSACRAALTQRNDMKRAFAINAVIPTLYFWMCFDHSFAVAILQNGSLQTVQLIQSFEELWRKCDGLLNWISIVKFKHKKKKTAQSKKATAVVFNQFD